MMIAYSQLIVSKIIKKRSGCSDLLNNRMFMVTIKQINYVLAVSKTLHFKKAADMCHVSPSALSMAISELENQLGIQVFERDNKRVIITSQGCEIIAKARDIKAKLDEISGLGLEKAPPLSGPISLGIIPTVSPYLLPIVLPCLQNDYPTLSLTITEGQSTELIRQVEQGMLDMAILALPFDVSELVTYKFWSEDFYYVTHVDNLEPSETSIDVNDLDPSELMLLEDGHCLKDHALAACKLSDKTHFDVRVSSLTTIIQLVIGKMGSTLVPHMALEPLTGSFPSLAKLPLNQSSPHRELVIGARPTYPGTENILHLTRLLSKSLAVHYNIGQSRKSSFMNNLDLNNSLEFSADKDASGVSSQNKETRG